MTYWGKTKGDALQTMACDLLVGDVNTLQVAFQLNQYSTQTGSMSMSYVWNKKTKKEEKKEIM